MTQEALHTINEHREFFDAVVSRAARSVANGADVGEAIKDAMRSVVKDQADLIHGETHKSRAFKSALVGQIFIDINKRAVIRRLEA